MKTQPEDFIRVYKKVFPGGYCEHLISEFERLVMSGSGTDRQRGEGAKRHIKNDTQLELNLPAHTAAPFDEQGVSDVFFSGVQKCFESYSEEFSILAEGKVRATAMKMQRTDPGGGYHIWHSEQGDGYFAERVLVYSLYLNTLSTEEAGETEYLYQQKRITPVKNTMVLWPATFTHAHRGNTVFGDRCKYIVTGWFYYE